MREEAVTRLSSRDRDHRSVSRLQECRIDSKKINKKINKSNKSVSKSWTFSGRDIPLRLSDIIRLNCQRAATTAVVVAIVDLGTKCIPAKAVEWTGSSRRY